MFILQTHIHIQHTHNFSAWLQFFKIIIIIITIIINPKQTNNPMIYYPINIEKCIIIILSQTEEPVKVSTCAHDRHALQQLALNEHIKHFDRHLKCIFFNETLLSHWLFSSLPFECLTNPIAVGWLLNTILNINWKNCTVLIYLWLTGPCFCWHHTGCVINISNSLDVHGKKTRNQSMTSMIQWLISATRLVGNGFEHQYRLQSLVGARCMNEWRNV